MSRQTWTGAGSVTAAAAFSMMSRWSGESIITVIAAAAAG